MQANSPCIAADQRIRPLAILDALDKNRIAALTADKSSGIIQTDWIAGPSKVIITMNQSNRYKYNITRLVKMAPSGERPED